MFDKYGFEDAHVFTTVMGVAFAIPFIVGMLFNAMGGRNG